MVTNFAVKEQGLEAQLLATVVKHERADLDKQKNDLVVKVSAGKNTQVCVCACVCVCVWLSKYLQAKNHRCVCMCVRVRVCGQSISRPKHTGVCECVWLSSIGKQKRTLVCL